MLSANMTVFGEWAFKDRIRLNEVIRLRLPNMTGVLRRKRDTR
jgi:hypothetical protein